MRTVAGRLVLAAILAGAIVLGSTLPLPTFWRFACALFLSAGGAAGVLLGVEKARLREIERLRREFEITQPAPEFEGSSETEEGATNRD